MLEPVESLVYLYYKCSKCGEVGDEVRLIETQLKNPRHICMFCENVDSIKPISNITFNYRVPETKQRESQKVPVSVDLAKYQKVFKSLVKLGYGKDESQKVINELTKTKYLSTQELFKQAVLKLDEERTKTN